MQNSEWLELISIKFSLKENKINFLNKIDKIRIKQLENIFAE